MKPMFQRSSFVPVSWVAGCLKPRQEDVRRREEFVRTRNARAKQRVNKEFPPIKLLVN